MATMKELIDKGSRKMGNAKALADAIGQHPDALTGAKAGRRGLPNDACVKLAQIVGTDPLEVIAASELTTEKKPEKRAFWESYQARAAVFAASCSVTSLLTPYPGEAITYGKSVMTLFLLC